MAKERLSGLQKVILTTLYQLGGKNSRDEVELVDEGNTEKIKELESQGFKDGGLVRLKEFRGVKRYFKPVLTGYYQLNRSKLLYSVNRWQDYNSYTPESQVARTLGWKKRQKGMPPGYNKKSAALTRSLQILASKELVDLLGNYDQGLSVYGTGFAKRLGMEPQDLQAEREAALKKYTADWLEEAMKDPPGVSFSAWFNEKQPNIFGQAVSKKEVWEANHKSRNDRNIKKVQMTPKGVEKAEYLLKVNYYIPTIN